MNAADHTSKDSSDPSSIPILVASPPSPAEKYGREDDSNVTDQLLGSDALKPTDLEGQRHNSVVVAKATGAEYSVATRTKLLYLGVYFLLNLLLTVYNKAVLGNFAFPWLLTSLHTGTTALGCYVLMQRGHVKITKLSQRENLTLLLFSLLFTVNIAISNVSLAMVSVPFHQILRSATPIFAVFIYRFYFNRSYSNATYISLIPVIFGVVLVTYGDYYFTVLGFALTTLGVLLAALKTIASNRLMTGNLKLPPLELLLRMSPLAAIQSFLYAAGTGELGRFVVFISDGKLPPSSSLALVGNGVLACLLNISSFQTNKLAGALTITVCGNIKQCLTVIVGILLFDVRVSVLNGLGMLITLAGAAVYSKVELDSKGLKKVVAADKTNIALS